MLQFEYLTNLDLDDAFMIMVGEEHAFLTDTNIMVVYKKFFF